MKRQRPRSDSKRGTMVNEIRSIDVLPKFRTLIPELTNISAGKVKCSRHEQYASGSCRIRNQLKSRSNMISCLSIGQYEEIIDFLIATFCQENKMHFSYVADVLYPEGVRLLVMKTLGVTNSEALEVMFSEPYVQQEQEDSDTDSDFECDTKVIGEGGFGVVYKGRLRHTVVAVKFLTKEGTASLATGCSEGGTMLKRELAALAKFRHPNIIGVMGFSNDKPVSALVYQYVAGGSLFDRLHKDVGRPLDWLQRAKILSDTCRGLLYLHSAATPLVHQDIKSQNILIGSDGGGKISDFGFAIELPRVCDDGRSLFTAQIFARSEGYFPSELTSGKYSAKSDVYSYGVVVLETFCGLKVFTCDREDPKLVDFLEDDLRDQSRFIERSDPAITKCNPKLGSFYHSLVTEALKRHSKRPTSQQVMQMWENLEQ